MVKLQYARRIKKLSEHIFFPRWYDLFRTVKGKYMKRLMDFLILGNRTIKYFPLFLSIVTFVSDFCICVSRKEGQS